MEFRRVLFRSLGDADLVSQRRVIRYGHDGADRARDGPRIGEDLVGGRGDVVAARGGHAAERGDHRLALAHASHLVVDLLRGGDGAAGRVDAQHHRDGRVAGAEALERLDQVGGVLDHAAQLDHAHHVAEERALAEAAPEHGDPRHQRQRRQRDDGQDGERAQDRVSSRHALGPRPRAPGHRRLALLLLGLGHHVREREAPAVALARQVGLHVGALLALAQRLDGEADTLLARVDAGALRFDRVARLEERGRLVDALAGELRDVHQPLDPLLQLDEHAEVGDARDRALDARAGRVAPGHLRPRVVGELLDAERDTLVVHVDAKHDRLDLVALLVQLRGVLHLLRPVEVGDVHQAVDVLLHLDEEAEVGDALDLAADLRAHRVVHAHQLPWIRLGLLHAERDALALRVVLEDDHLHAVADVDDLGGMRDPAPRHVGHVEEPVDAAEIDEGAVVGDVLDRALEDDTLLQYLERLGLERRALALEDRSPGHDHVAARAVELEDGEAPALPDVAIEVARRPEVGVRAWEERGHADVHLESALHLADDRPFDRAVALVGLLDLAPDLELLRLLPREDDVARLGVARLEVDVDFVALVHGELALARGELVGRDGALGLVADVDRDRVAPDEDDPAGADLALLRLLQAPLEEGTKVLFGADRTIGLLRRLGHQGTTPCGRDFSRNAGEPVSHTPLARSI